MSRKISWERSVRATLLPHATETVAATFEIFALADADSGGDPNHKVVVLAAQCDLLASYTEVRSV